MATKTTDYLKSIKKYAVEDYLDLDVYMSDYSEAGYSVYSTESIDINAGAEKRKKVFEKSEKGKQRAHAKN